MSEIGLETTPHSQYSGTKFEPAIHLTSFVPRAYETQQKIFSQIRSGDFSLNGWNAENSALKLRLLAYPNRPIIFSIDGVSPSLDLNNREDRIFQLYTLPVMPSELGTESIYVVRGDLVGDVPLEGFPSSSGKLGMGAPLQELIPTMAEQYLALPIIWSVAVAAESAKKVATSGMTRRGFLRRAAIASAGSVIGLSAHVNMANILPRSAASADSQESKDMLLNVMDFVKPRLFPVSSAHARTATVLMKHLDGIDELGLNKSVSGALIFGAEHGYNANEIMSDASKMNQWVREGGEIMANALVDIHKSGKFIFDLQLAMKSLFDYIPTYDVIKVEEPENGAKSLPEVRIETILQPRQSPRVAAALAGVKQKYQI